MKLLKSNLFIFACFSLMALGFISVNESSAKVKPSSAKVVKASSEEDKLYAQCLKDKGITMYGTSWCPHCKHQKAEFGELFSYVNYIDCDVDKKTCLKNKVTGYPTWLLPSGEEIQAGTVKEVAQACGCDIKNYATPAKNESSQEFQAPSASLGEDTSADKQEFQTNPFKKDAE